MGDLLRAPRFWNQWITEAEVIDVIHHNQKSRFEVNFQRGHYQVRALQGHSISHVRDDLVLTQLSIEDTPDYAAHGAYYDFYESILRHGLMAGGQQGPSFRRHVHLVEQLPWEGAISGTSFSVSPLRDRAVIPPQRQDLLRRSRECLSWFGTVGASLLCDLKKSGIGSLCIPP